MAYSTGNTNQLQTASLQDAPTYTSVDGLSNPLIFGGEEEDSLGTLSYDDSINCLFLPDCIK